MNCWHLNHIKQIKSGDPDKFYCNGNCCNPNNCETCVGSQCLPCGGRPYEACCGGQCYDTRTQKCCTSLFGNEHICNINKTCCLTGICCDPDKICCNNATCAKSCELKEDPGKCSGETVMCPLHCGALICEEEYQINWTGNKVYNCSEPGCPGDCQDVEVICQKKTRCRNNMIGGQACYFGMCNVLPGGGSGCLVCQIGFAEPQNIPTTSHICME